MREIVLDTETTGLDPSSGHRLVELACVEIDNLVATGRIFHVYLDPERSVPEEAFRIHGLSTEFLKGQKLFSEIHLEFLNFIEDSRLIIHNAEFDVKFINAELTKAGSKPLLMERVFDTLTFARKKHPGVSNSLDALCARYKIDNSKRTKHGALLDAEILAELYLELMGGRQTALSLPALKKTAKTIAPYHTTDREVALASSIEATDLEQHARLTLSLGAVAVWNRYQKA